MLMQDIGSNQTAATSLTLTFSNCVPANPLPTKASEFPLTNGVYNPTQYGNPTIFP
jgi:hypothetical protein